MNRNDYPYAVIGSTMDIVVQTNGNDLTEEIEKLVTNFTSMKPMQENSFYMETDLELDAENCYLIQVSGSSREQMIADCRRLMLELDGVEEAYVADWNKYSQVTWTRYAFFLTPIDGTADLSQMSIPELQDCTVIKWSDGLYLFVMDEAFADELGQIEFSNQYEKFCYMTEYAETIRAAHNDVLEKVEPAVEWDETDTNPVGTLCSVWESAGDADSDGKVTASDAAVVLVAAAEAGTGQSDALNNDEDVNGDSAIDAIDAALILRYAAYVGADGTESMTNWLTTLA